MARGIYKRGGIYWIRYTGLDGKQKREPAGPKFKDAETKLSQRKQTILAEGKEPEIKKIGNHIFSELIEKYKAWIDGRHNSAKVKGYIIGQLLAFFGDIPLRRFSTSLVDQLQTELIGKGYKASSNNKVLTILKHMINKAVEWDMVELETLKRIRKVKLLKDDSKRLRYLSSEECHTLIGNCEPHLRPIVITAINTGMRRGEILGLKWDHVDLKHGFILLDKTKNGERREIPINDSLRGALQGITRRLDVPHVFYDSAKGRPYQEVKRSFYTALRRSGITDFHFHDLRHTFASHLVMSGVDLTTVSRLLGHKSLTMTLRYSHLAPSHLVKTVDILDSTINGKTISTKLAQFGASR